MNRTEAAAYVGERLGAYLTAAGRTAADSAGNLKGVIDDALRALGYGEDELATAETTTAAATEDLRVQVLYRTLVQIVRDLGAQMFDLSSPEASLKLSQLRVAAEKELARAEAAVIARFSTTEIVTEGGGLVSVDLNFLAPTVEELAGVG